MISDRINGGLNSYQCVRDCPPTSSEFPKNPFSWSPKTLRYEAHSLTEKFVFWEFFKQDILPDLLKYAEIYQGKTYDKIIVLGNDQNEDVIKIPYITRFSKEYPDKVKQKLKSVLPILKKYDKFHFLTLTVDPKMFTSLNASYEYLQSLWNKVLTRLRKKYPHIFIVKTIEMQYNGYPHLHVLIAGIGYLPRSWVLKTKEMGLQFYKSKYLRGYSYKRAFYYILKYILKGSNDNSEWGYIQKVIQWALFSRTFTTSRLSLNTAKINSNDMSLEVSWYIIAIFEKGELKDDVNTKDQILYLKRRGG